MRKIKELKSGIYKTSVTKRSKNIPKPVIYVLRRDKPFYDFEVCNTCCFNLKILKPCPFNGAFLACRCWEEDNENAGMFQNFIWKKNSLCLMEEES